MFDRPAVRLLREQLQAALNEIAEQLDVSIQLGGATFTEDNVTFKLEVARINEDGEAVNRSRSDFQRTAIGYGLKPEDLDREFQMRGKTYKLVGAKPRCSKYPLLCECGGKRFKFAAEHVRLLLQDQKQAALVRVRQTLHNPPIK